MSVAGIFPTVARDFVSASNSTSREHNRFSPKDSKAAAYALVTKSADDTVTIFQQRKDSVLHVNLDPLVNTVVLQGADHLQSSAIADMGEARIFMSAKISLQDAAVFCPIENRTPRFELAHAVGRFLCVQLRHAPLVDVLTAAHRVGEMH